ncbi:MAG TPA: hypothetical protein VEC16_02620 [Alphaproteobacteria bacterium]|nr:hypothetical protein [Alphaproteobacteria bacterium]
MKKIIMMVLMLSLFASSVLAESSMTVSVSNYDPFPASPGQTVKVSLLVQNTGDEDLQNIKVEIVEQAPFSVYSDNISKTIPLLGAHKDYLIDFNLRVDSDAVEGDNILKVRYTFDGAVQSKDLAIDVQSRDATLTIEKVEVEPTEITPGSDGILTITVKNNAPTAMTDLSMKLILQSIVGTSLVDLPFAPMDSGTERRLYLLQPGDTTEFKYTLRAYPDAASKVYKIPFTLSYYDNQGTLNNESDFVGVIVNGMPEISMIIDETDLNDKKRSGTVTFKIINKGVSDVKFLNVIVKENENFELLSNSDSTYVGNLVSDDYQTADYLISINSKEDNVVIPVTLQYRDANNQYYEQNYDVKLALIDSSKIDSGSSGSGMIIFILIIVAVIGGIWYYRRSKKKARK